MPIVYEANPRCRLHCGVSVLIQKCCLCVPCFLMLPCFWQLQQYLFPCFLMLVLLVAPTRFLFLFPCFLMLLAFGSSNKIPLFFPGFLLNCALLLVAPTRSPFLVIIQGETNLHDRNLSMKGLASYCKAETTFTFHFSIINA